MKIIILAAAALVATTLSAAAAHDVDGGHVDGVLGTPGWTKKEVVTEIVDGNNVQGLYEILNGDGVGVENAAPEGEEQGARMPDGSGTGNPDF